MRSLKGRRATDLAVPLRAALGRRQPVAAALRRLQDQDCDLAPVVEGRRAIGLMARSSLEAAARYRLESIPVSSLAGDAPRGLPWSAGHAKVLGALRGGAPGVIVRGPDGVPAGLIPRRLMDGAWERAGGAPPARVIAGRLRAGLPRELFKLLRRASRIARARGEALYLVGGVVRDLMSGGAGKDVDLVAARDAGGLARELAASTGGRVVTHPRFLTARVSLAGGARVDVATARSETYAAPGGLPQVRPGSLEQDLERRDVSINAMAIRLDGAHFGVLVDPLGGMADLQQHVMRVHHALSLTEDPTRALRIGRLAARLGCRLAPQTSRSLALAMGCGAFDRVSGERFMQELRLVAAEPDPIAALRQVDRIGALGAISSGMRVAPGARAAWRRLRPCDPDGPLASVRGMPAPDLLVALLCADSAPAAVRRRIARRLRLAGEPLRRFIEAPATAARVLRVLRAETGLHRTAARLEREPPEAILLALSRDTSRSVAARALACLRFRALRPRVGGGDLARMGLDPGPQFGRILAALRAARLSGRVTDVESELRLARRLVSASLRRGASGTARARTIR